jgi:hypothetical protein
VLKVFVVLFGLYSECSELVLEKILIATLHIPTYSRFITMFPSSFAVERGRYQSDPTNPTVLVGDPLHFAADKETFLNNQKYRAGSSS